MLDIKVDLVLKAGGSNYRNWICSQKQPPLHEFKLDKLVTYKGYWTHIEFIFVFIADIFTYLAYEEWVPSKSLFPTDTEHYFVD